MDTPGFEPTRFIASGAVDPQLARLRHYEPLPVLQSPAATVMKPVSSASCLGIRWSKEMLILGNTPRSAMTVSIPASERLHARNPNPDIASSGRGSLIMAAAACSTGSSSGGAHSVHRVLHMDRSWDSQESEIAPDSYLATAHNTNSADPPTARRPPRTAGMRPLVGSFVRATRGYPGFQCNRADQCR